MEEEIYRERLRIIRESLSGLRRLLGLLLDHLDQVIEYSKDRPEKAGSQDDDF